MFVVNSVDKTPSKIKEISFKDVGLKERNDL